MTTLPQPGKKKLERREAMDRTLVVPAEDTQEFELRLPKTKGNAWSNRRVRFTVVLAHGTGKRRALTSREMPVGQVH